MAELLDVDALLDADATEDGELELSEADWLADDDEEAFDEAKPEELREAEALLPVAEVEGLFPVPDNELWTEMVEDESLLAVPLEITEPDVEVWPRDETESDNLDDAVPDIRELETLILEPDTVVLADAEVPESESIEDLLTVGLTSVDTFDVVAAIVFVEGRADDLTIVEGLGVGVTTV